VAGVRDQDLQEYVAPSFSQMPTLGEFIARARHYGYTKHTIRISELGARLVYLRRVRGAALELVDLPPMRETDRLTREVPAPPRSWALGVSYRDRESKCRARAKLALDPDSSTVELNELPAEGQP
jgi:hypothetical protein